ncbi:MAG: copper oxidase [Methylococcales bacterium]
MKLRLLPFLGIFALSAVGHAKEQQPDFVDHDTMLMDHGNGHLMNMDGGMVMGQNKEILPGGCKRISDNKELTIKAGHKFAKPFPGRMFAFDQQELRYKPCTRLTIHLINEDNIRHQFMMHGLPKYIYPRGMFHLEVTGPGKISGTLIFPSGDQTFLYHCDIAQHMGKGMKGQIIIGKGSGTLPSIPGISALAIPDSYDRQTIEKREPDEHVVPVEKKSAPLISGIFVIGLALGLLVAPILARRYKGMTASEIGTDVLSLVKSGASGILQFISWLAGLLGGQKKEF